MKPDTYQRKQAAMVRNNPFLRADGRLAVGAETRLDMVSSFDLGDCHAALNSGVYLQGTVKDAIQNRIRQLTKGGAA